MTMPFYAVIMAGGGGTRLWPLSRSYKPKQMLQISGDRTLFQIAVDRLGGLFPADRILVVTVKEQADELHRQCSEIPRNNFLIEPMPRGTASVVGIAAMALKRMAKQSTMAILTADHFIEMEDRFRQTLEAAYAVAQDDYLVTLGIQPTYPATGYGYIQRGEKVGVYNQHEVYRALKFKEKPDQTLAETFISSGDHAWNSGMFIWRTDRIISEFQQSMPDLYQTLAQIESYWDSQNTLEIPVDLWQTIKPETIDYGIMEKASQVAVLPAGDLGWNDVGSWESLFDVLKPDENGNILINAQHLGIDTQTSLVCSEKGDRLIVTIGAKNLVIVDTKDALLICDREDTQKVRDIVNLLKKTGQTQYL